MFPFFFITPASEGAGRARRAISHRLLGGDYARGEFELKDDPAGVAAGGGAPIAPRARRAS